MFHDELEKETYLLIFLKLSDFVTKRGSVTKKIRINMNFEFQCQKKKILEFRFRLVRELSLERAPNYFSDSHAISLRSICIYITLFMFQVPSLQTLPRSMPF